MYCHQCGTLNDDQASFCKQCGASLKPVSGQTAAPATPGIPAAFPIVVRYAGFWKRFVAYFLDIIIIDIVAWAVSFIVGLILGLMSANSYGLTNDYLGVYFFFVPVFIVGDWLYFALMESSPKQATLGKQALRIIVTDLDGKKISFGQATGRFISKLFSIIIFFIGYIMVAFTDKKQGLHDMIAGTLVVTK